jgi:hypothetical protein
LLSSIFIFPSVIVPISFPSGVHHRLYH